MSIENASIPRSGTAGRLAFDAAIADISSNGTQVLISKAVLIIPKVRTVLNQSLTFLSGKNGFIPSELNTGERLVRKHFA